MIMTHHHLPTVNTYVYTHSAPCATRLPYRCCSLLDIYDLPLTTLSPTELFADGAVIHHALKDLSTERLDRVPLSFKAADEWALTWRGRFGHAKTRL